MIYDRQIREARHAEMGRRAFATRKSVDATVIRRTESVDDTLRITLLQAGIIQQVFAQAELRFRHGGGVLMAGGKGKAQW